IRRAGSRPARRRALAAERRARNPGHRALPSGRPGADAGVDAMARAPDHAAPPARRRARPARSERVTRRGRLFLPTLTSHLVREVLRTFALMMVAFVAIFVMVDFFDRFDDFLKQGASAGTIALLFMHRIPLVVAQVMPVAVLAGALVGLGLLARNNEFVALRSCGVSLWQVTAPLAAVGILIGVVNFVWGDTVVPASARRSHEIWNHDVKKRNAPTGVFAGRDIWFHGKAGFYNINRVAPARHMLYGVT